MILTRRFDKDSLNETPADISYFGRQGGEAQVKEVSDLPGFSRVLRTTQSPGNRWGITPFNGYDNEESGEFLILQRMSGVVADTSTEFVGAAMACDGDSDSSISCRVGIFRQPLRVQFATYNNGNFSNISADDANPSWDARNWHFLRVRFQFLKIQMRWWGVNDPEPGVWHYETTSATPTTINPAKVGWMCSHSVGHELAGISFAPLRASESFSYFGEVSGVISDHAGEPSQRDVRLIHRDTGQIVAAGQSDPVTGEYTLTTNRPGEHQRIVLGSDDPLYNDLVDRVIPG